MKTALLTGSASGIGLHLTSVLLREGYKVFACDINIEGLREQMAKHNWPKDSVELFKLDVRDWANWVEAIAHAEEKFGELDLIMNIAGYITPGYVHETDPYEVNKHIDVNVKGVMYGTMAALHKMVPRKKGHVVNFASLAGISPVPGIGIYSASKFAVRGFTLAVAEEVRPHGVSISVVCPDLVNTPMLDKQLPYKEAALTFSGNKPLTVEDIEAAILTRVLKGKELEVALPWNRGWLCRFGNLFPGLAESLGPGLAEKGIKNQSRYKNLLPK